jgi:methylthioribose-1-phosphate isomerase
MYDEDIHANREMGRLGQGAIADGAGVDALQRRCAGDGWLRNCPGVIRAAVEAKQTVKCMRMKRPLPAGSPPYGQVTKDNIPVTSSRRHGGLLEGCRIDCVIEADRIAANGM